MDSETEKITPYKGSGREKWTLKNPPDKSEIAHVGGGVKVFLPGKKNEVPGWWVGGRTYEIKEAPKDFGGKKGRRGIQQSTKCTTAGRVFQRRKKERLVWTGLKWVT